MEGMVQQLDDPYSEFFNPARYVQFQESLEGEFSGVGIEITVIADVVTVIAPLAGTPAEAAGVRAGDQILAIDGESTDGFTLSEAAMRIRGETGTAVVLTVRHEDGVEEEIPIVRAKITVSAVESDTIGEGRIAYVRLSRFEADVAGKLDRALASFDLETMDGMILDLRNNPGGYTLAAIQVASRFVDEGVIYSSRGRFSKEQRHWSTSNVIPNLPLAVLINGGSASASEIVAGAIRDHRMGVLVGEQTFGKGVMQNLLEFADGSALKLTIAEFFSPNGNPVHEVGVAPDIAVDEDEDPIDVAIAWIDGHVGERMPLESTVGQDE